MDCLIKKLKRSNMKTINLNPKLLFLLIISLCPLIAFSQEAEGISQEGKVVIMGPDMNINDYVKQFVENKIFDWQQKGEFEKTSDYEARVTEQSRRAKADELAATALDELKKLYSQTIDWKQMVAKDYDADHETYLLEHPVLGQFALPIKAEDASSLKAHLGELTFSNIDFYLKDNKFYLTKLTATNPADNKSFSYDNKLAVTHVVQKIDYNFSAIDVKVPQNNQEYHNNTTIQEQTRKVGSDPVDTDIPETKVDKPNTFAVLIGNENYANERSVPFAMNDASTLKKYLNKTLGLPENNVKYFPNATYGQIMGAVQWLTDIEKAYAGKASIIFYYAGHGMPDESSKDAYLLPVDGNSEMPQTAMKLEWLYNELNKYPTAQVSILMDACFSGASRDGMLAKGRGVKIRPKENVLQGNFLAFSAASGDQTAFPYSEKGHGLFTYFLLKKLQESKGQATMGELTDYVKENVAQKAVVINSKPQTPVVNVSYNIENTWSTQSLAK
jgi:hypothetical protein